MKHILLTLLACSFIFYTNAQTRESLLQDGVSEQWNKIQPTLTNQAQIRRATDVRIIGKSTYQQRTRVDSTTHYYAQFLGTIFTPNDNSLYIESTWEITYDTFHTPKGRTIIVYDTIWVPIKRTLDRYDPLVKTYYPACGDAYTVNQHYQLIKKEGIIYFKKDSFEKIYGEVFFLNSKDPIHLPEPRGGGHHPYLDSTIFSWINGTLTEPATKITLKHADAGNRRVLLEKTRSSWDTLTKTWKNGSRNVYTYDQSDSSTLATATFGLFEGNTYKPSSKSDYKYDTAQLIKFKENSQWQSKGDSWLAVSREYFFRTSGLTDSVVFWGWGFGSLTWNKQIKHSYKYNKEKYPTWFQVSHMKINGFQSYSETNYYYESYTPSLTHVKLTKSETFVKCYPNPTDQFLNVNLSSFTTGKIQFKLVNSMGKEINSQSFDITTQEENIRLDLQSLSSGIYFLQITSSDNKLHTIRISKK